MEVISSILLGIFSLGLGIVMGAGALQLTFRFLHNVRNRQILRDGG